MVVLGLLFWFFVPLIAPTSLLATVADIPLVSLLLADKRIVAARFGSFLCLWNIPYDLHISLFWAVAARLISIECCYFFLKHMLTEQLPRSLLASVALSTCASLFSLILLPDSLRGWSYTLFFFASFLPMLSTLFLFAMRYGYTILNRKRRENS